jgi:hypothetical protein
MVIRASLGIVVTQPQRKIFPRNGIEQRRYQFPVGFFSALFGFQQDLFNLPVEIGGGHVVNRRRNQRQSCARTGAFVFFIGHGSLAANGFLFGLLGPERSGLTGRFSICSGCSYETRAVAEGFLQRLEMAANDPEGLAGIAVGFA